jgi:DNA-binding CsgD family transcriptional regulator/tetratricopeptide (TPR) repeat protein
MDTSRPLIARRHELQVLDACLSAARTGGASIVLVRGESGLGKSRLAGSVAEQARRDGMFVAVGHCTPVSGPELPFGPFVELLSQIGATPGPEPIAGTTWERLRDVLTVSAPSSGVLSPDVGLERSRLFTSVLWVLHTIGERQPVVLVLEDVHWADSSSLDLLNYLARTAGRERLLLVLTCRDDDLGHDATTRRGIRELSRAEMTRDLHLQPFADDEIRELLATSHVRLPAEHHDRVVELCDGNPFMALELAARDEIGGAHTEALRDALLGPVDELPDDARLALHVAAVLGESIPHEVLEKAIESTGREVGATLRLLTGRGLLVAGAERYDFRHAILRESVLREMLHSERTAAHRSAVQGLRLSGVDGSPAALPQLAHHLVAAGEYVAALPTVMAAADHARSVYAFAEARRELALVRELLWSHVDDPEGLSGVSAADLACREAEMARWAGEPSAAVTLLHASLVTVAPTGLDRARLELELAEALWAAGDPAAALASCERSEAALATVPGEPALKARVLAAIAGGLVMTGKYDRGRAVAERAIARARESGATRSLLQARITRATATARQGDLEAGVAELRDCLAEAVAADAFKAVVRCYGNLAFLHSTAGRLGEVLEISTEGARACRRFGPLLLVAPTLAENWVHALVATGRWDEAAQVAQDLQQQWAAEGMALALHLQLAQVAAARGSGADFDRQMSIIDGFARPDDPYAVHDVTAAHAEYLLWQGGADRAHRITQESLAQLRDQEDAGLVVSMCSLALRAHADLVTSRAGSPAESTARATDLLLATAREAALEDTGALGRVYLLLCEAEAARASLAPAVDPWAQVVAEWQQLDCPYPAAYAQWRLAQELFGARARAQGTRALGAALQTATRLGCGPLEAAVRLVARHAGVPGDELDGSPTAPVVTPTPASARLPVPLTPREEEVLRILTEGHSNQQIARRLFISESTVSVHVSHIIAKLGVANRLQAASAAERLKLFH